MRRMKPVIQIYDSEEGVLRTLATAETVCNAGFMEVPEVFLYAG